MLQVTRTTCVFDESRTALAEMRRSFERHHAITLPRFFDIRLVDFVLGQLRGARFSDRDDGIAREACMAENPLLAMLHLITNDQRLFDAISAITGCGPIGMFLGRVYQMHAAAGHADQWHSDASHARLIGMSVNLTERAFVGGVFELRDRGAEAPAWSVANTQPGDAFLFEINDGLQHRVTTVEGTEPRVAYAGWFHSHPSFLTLLKQPRTIENGHSR